MEIIYYMIKCLINENFIVEYTLAKKMFTRITKFKNKIQIDISFVEKWKENNKVQISTFLKFE